MTESRNGARNVKTNLTRKNRGTHALLLLAGAALAVFWNPVSALPQSEQVAERVAALKKSLAESQARLKQYEWIETTVTRLKGEEKSRKQNRCYYGADGEVQKVPVSAAPQQQQGKKRGMKARIVENKKEEMAEYMQRATSLVKRYVPPTPDGIQAAKDAGNVAVEKGEGGHVRVNIRGYVKPGDNLAIEADLASNRVLGMKVSSYLDDKQDVVGLEVHFGLLPDGTNYADRITLDATAKNVRVAIENSGHRKAAN